MQKLKQLILSQMHNIKSLSVLVLVNFFIAGFGFVTKVKIANTLGKADFGLFAYGIAISSYGASIIRFGLDRTLVRDLIHHPGKKGQIVVSSLVLRCVLFGLFTFVLIIWKFISTATSDLTWGVLLVVLSNSMIALELKAFYDSIGKFNRHSVYNLIQRGLYYAAVWLMIILMPKKLSVYWLGVFTLASVVIYLLMQGQWALPKLDIDGKYDDISSETMRLAKSNLLIWFSCIACLSFGVVNQIILKIMKGRIALGSYAAAWQLVVIAMLFISQIARIGNPAMARITRPGMDVKTRILFLFKYSGVMILAVIPISLSSILFPELILKTIFKPEYITAATSLIVFGFYMLVFSVAIVASQYLICAHMEQAYFVSVVLGGILGIILCLVLIPVWGESGAAFSLLLSHGVALVSYYIAIGANIKRKLKLFNGTF